MLALNGNAGAMRPIRPARLVFQRGTGMAVRLPQATLARLALGAYAPADLLARLERPPEGQTRALLEALFPLRHPHLSLPDRF